MRYTILFSIFLFAILAGCNKEKNGSKPTLKFKSVNTTILSNGEDLYFTLSFTQGSSDLAGSMFVQEIVPNCSAPGSGFADLDSLPQFPASKNQAGELVVHFSYDNDVSPKCQQNDTAVFRFAVRDINNRSSDTVSSPPIIILYQ